MKKIYYNSGEFIGDCIYLYDIESKNKYKREALFECQYCGTVFNAVIMNVKNYHTRSCGCYNVAKLKERSTHGLSDHPLFRKWNQIKQRCDNKKVWNYRIYGGRSIKLYHYWINDFYAFYKYVTGLPGYDLTLTLDRINNDGNYEPGNLRWADYHIQNANQGKYITNSSGYTGVSKRGSKYRSVICVRNKPINIGTFNTLNDAVLARNAYIINNNLLEYPLQNIEATQKRYSY